MALVRFLRCPYPYDQERPDDFNLWCQCELPLRDDKNYLTDYGRIAKHSRTHDPAVIGPWLEAGQKEIDEWLKTQTEARPSQSMK